jgi:hypothetical protein
LDFAVAHQYLGIKQYFDATYQAIVACSMRWLGVLETPTLPTMQPTGPEQLPAS